MVNDFWGQVMTVQCWSFDGISETYNVDRNIEIVYLNIQCAYDQSKL